MLPAPRSTLLSFRPITSSFIRSVCPQCRHAAGFARKRDNPQPLRTRRKPTSSSVKQKATEQKRILSRATSDSPDGLPVRPPTYGLPSIYGTSASTSAQEATPTESYLVRRTPTRNLPIYQLAKGGGTLKQTRVRKISGNAHELVKQLEGFLEPRPEWCRVNGVNGHVVMKVCPLLRQEGWDVDRVL